MCRISRSRIPTAEPARYVAPIRRLNVTIPDDLDAVLREAAKSSLSEGDFIRDAILEKALHDRYAALRREVKAEVAALHRDVLQIKQQLELTSGTPRRTRSSPASRSSGSGT